MSLAINKDPWIFFVEAHVATRQHEERALLPVTQHENAYVYVHMS